MTKKQKKYAELANVAMLAGAALMNPKRAMKLVKAKPAKKSTKKVAKKTAVAKKRGGGCGGGKKGK